MRIVVIGCGRTGALLARSLAEKGHEVVVVDSDTVQFGRLGSDFAGRTVTGVGFDRDVLLRAGIEGAGGVAAVTDNEMTNLLAAYIARQHFRVPRVVARLFEPERAQLYDHIDVPVVTAVSWRVERLEQLLCQPALSVPETLGNGEVVIVDWRVPESWVGRPFSSLTRPGEVVAVALVRAGRAQLPAADVSLEAGDVVRLTAVAEALDGLQQELADTGGAL